MMRENTEKKKNLALKLFREGRPCGMPEA